MLRATTAGKHFKNYSPRCALISSRYFLSQNCLPLSSRIYQERYHEWFLCELWIDGNEECSSSRTILNFKQPLLKQRILIFQLHQDTGILAKFDRKKNVPSWTSAYGDSTPDYSRVLVSAKHGREFPGHRVHPGYVSFPVGKSRLNPRAERYVPNARAIDLGR